MPLQQIYIAIELILVVVTFLLGVALLVIKVPDKESLKNYRFFRVVMACSYFCLCASTLLEIFSTVTNNSSQFSQALYLSISAVQAFLFTHAYITLVNYKYVTCKRMLFNLIHVFIIGLSVFLFASLSPLQTYFGIVFTLMTIYYILLLGWYTFVFLTIYRQYILKVDNYYAEMETVRMKWIYFSFFASLMVGILAVISAIFSNVLVISCLLMLYISIFYAYFGIRFINYVLQFQFLEPLLNEEKELNINYPVNGEKETNSNLARSIDKWISEEKFLSPNITIVQAAKELNTNRTYLSEHIKTTESATFREWIHNLRIEKAKEILLQKPSIPIVEVSMAVGYSDSSNFNKQFVKYTGIPAQAWRTKNLSKVKPFH